MPPKSLRRAVLTTLTAGALTALAQPVQACTSFRLQSQDGAWIAARSMEFQMDLKSQLMLVPKGQTLTATRPDLKPGMAWTAKHGFLGFNAVGLPIAADGLNEAGLSVGALFFPGFAEYQPFPADGKQAVSNVELANWILSQFATVDEVRAALPKLTVYELILPQMGPLPLHWTIRDAAGGSLVIEYAGGKLHMHDNPIGVLTNSPPFDWHQNNLRNNINLTNINVDSLKLGSVEVQPLGQGSGLIGLPGDFSPPSRFLKATAMVFSAVPVPTAEKGANLAFHILNTVDIPRGAVAAKIPSPTGGAPTMVHDKTEWATVYDLKHRIAYFRTYGDLTIRKVDLNRIDFGGKAIQYLPMPTTLQAQDMTPATAKPK